MIMTGSSGNQGRGKPLHRMFTAVPPRYDLINTLMTLGMDRLWRRQAALECLVSRPGKILDLCCGTGDLAIDLARKAGSGVSVFGLDYSQPMLEIASRKAAVLDGQPSFLLGDAANLPFPADYFNCVGISFAFRNLTYKNPLAQSHLAEVLRVLVPGGALALSLQEGEGEGWERGPYEAAAERFFARYGAGEAEGLLAGAGFRVLERGGNEAGARRWLQFLATRAGG